MPSLEEGDIGIGSSVRVCANLLVSQVLDEAFILAKAAEESGQPWRYLSLVKQLRFNKSSESECGDILNVSQGQENENPNNSPVNTIATSTPQKKSECSENSHTSRRLNDVSYFGQGDEDYDVHQDDLNKSTSMLINHLFDMSEVDRVVICDDMEITQTEPSNLLTQAMTKIMESYVNMALNIADEGERVYQHHSNENSVNEFTAYSFLARAFGSIAIEGVKDATLIDNDATLTPERNIHISGELTIVEEDDKSDESKIEETENGALYEKTFLTLNRDFDQLSEEDDYPVLQDPKGMALQEVDLLPPKESDDTLNVEHVKNEQFNAVSAVTASASSRKSSLVRRCRLQGARLLSCLRGWWRRKTPGKRKECRPPGYVRGFCPMSPHGRLRASSMLDNRNPRSPSPTRAVAWKFNTVNETLVKSTHWKDYTFEKHHDSQEFNMEC